MFAHLTLKRSRLCINKNSTSTSGRNQSSFSIRKKQLRVALRLRFKWSASRRHSAKSWTLISSLLLSLNSLYKLQERTSHRNNTPGGRRTRRISILRLLINRLLDMLISKVLIIFSHRAPSHSLSVCLLLFDNIIMLTALKHSPQKPSAKELPQTTD